MLLPDDIADRAAWAADIQSAFQLLDIPPCTENLCAALAVTEQESTFNADPAVPGLSKIARTEIERRAAERKVPTLLVNAALQLRSPDGFEHNPLHERVFALSERNAGRSLPRAAMPRIILESPRITRQLTTEWFATRVEQRYRRCINKAFGR